MERSFSSMAAANVQIVEYSRPCSTADVVTRT
jgi:hypothetical protein